MKKSIVWVAMCVAFMGTFSSCDKGEDPVPAIVGTWSRVEYVWTELPTGFTKYWDEYTLDSWGESGYTIVFKADGTYTRNFNWPGDPLNDKGTYTLEGNKLVLNPDSADALDYIEGFPPVGKEFDVDEEPSEIRLVMSQVITLTLPSDAAIDEAEGDLDAIADEDYKNVDVRVVYKFNKL